MRPAYPWSAVVGQDALKRALILCAIDPGIGGVLLSGPRGVAKTTLARALAQLVEGAFVELPLGASEERVTGTLDLSAVLRDGSVSFAPGLLARAHDGVLYVDEVNLLPDGLVDLLLDAAASGQNVVERDGVSQAHPARFVLIGTMNPEEGELRPQLTDRFGLAVDAEADIPPAQRAEILRARLAFERDPQAFCASFADAQAQLLARCRQARGRLAAIALDGPALQRVTEQCYAAHVEGVRADLAMLRAARAHAAWHGRDAITPDDVDAVAELALAHRRRPKDEPPRSGGGGSRTPPGSPRPAPQSGGGASGRAAAEASPWSEPDTPRDAADRGARAPVPVRAAPAPSLPSWLTTGRALNSELRRRASLRRARTTPAGRGRGTHASSGPIDWLASFTQARSFRITPSDLRHRARRAPAKQLWVIALDCSGSMLRGGALAAAKGVAHAFEREARRTGAHVALLSFRDSEAQLTLAPEVRASGRIHALEALGGGGGTPLRAALERALAVCASRKFRGTQAAKRIVLLTDGRSREPLSGLLTGRPDIALTVVDCELGRVRLGHAPALAAALGGSAIHVDSLR